jgi:translation initiation factor IF-2
VKADVQGSLEPLVNSLKKIQNDEVKLEILHSSTGNITESDVMLAIASNAVILGFNTDVDPVAKISANSAGIDIKTYNVIYHLLEDVERAMKGMMEPTYQEVVIGRAEVRQVFPIKKVGNVAGCYMRSGEGRRNSIGRLYRGKELIHTAKISSLKHLQENVRTVKEGFEFGVNLDNWDDYQPGDTIEFVITQKVER